MTTSLFCSITIIYTFPVLHDETAEYLLRDHFPYPRLCMFFSAALSIFSVFQFKNRKRQHLIVSLSRLMLTIAFFLVILLHLEEKSFGLGIILLIVPFISLISANFFINRDEKLVNSADRIH